MLTPDDYENDDVETVFESMQAALRQRDIERHNEELTAFWRDGLRIEELNEYNPKDWDISLMPNEIRGKLPKGDELLTRIEES